MSEAFVFKQFQLMHHLASMKVGTDAVLLGCWANGASNKNILDVGMGCGILALMMAQRFQSQITAIDIDRDSVIQATENFILSPWKERLKALHCSFQQYAEHYPKSADFIISNPPFFENSLKAPELRRNNARHNDTLSFADFNSLSRKVLSPRGSIQLILPFLSLDSFRHKAELEEFSFTRQTTVYSKPGMKAERVLLEFSLEKRDFRASELIIRNKDGSYTEDYKMLTREFYLAF